MATWLIYAGCSLLVFGGAFGLYASLTVLADNAGPADILGLLLMQGIVFSVLGSTFPRSGQQSLRTWLTYAGSALVLVFLGYSLYLSVMTLASDPSLANGFSALSMLGLLLVLGGTAVQRARS